MKIYTKTGDGGTTSLATGERIPKHHPQVEAYGELDELSAHLGMLRSMQIADNQKVVVHRMQVLLMQCSALLAGSKNHANFITNDDIYFIENQIDIVQAELPPLQGFIIVGGTMAASQCHVARCVCRRAERRVSMLDGRVENYAAILQLLNRMSDYLFVLARKLNTTENATEEVWK